MNAPPMDAAQILELCTQAYYATGNWERHNSRTRWVMDRPWYDRLRAATVPEDQEWERARAHACIWVDASASAPYKCPICPSGPFGSMKALSDHVAAMADPANREPGDGDQLFRIAIDVRDDGGTPHLETSDR